MLGQIMNMAEKQGIVTEKDFMTLTEKQVMEKLDKMQEGTKLSRLYKTFRYMTSIEHTDQALPEDQYFCVNLKVKQRYINPLVKDSRVKPGNDTLYALRLSEVSAKARRIIEDFKAFSDTAYGCVKLV